MNVRILTLSLCMLATPAFAEMTHDHEDQAASSPAAVAYDEANKKMHEGMSAPTSGNADVDFVKGMIPHHQGAIDMANVELKYGTDPKIRKLAKNVIAAQTGEIKMMQKWLDKQAK